jgi:hypothetical protein
MHAMEALDLRKTPHAFMEHRWGLRVARRIPVTLQAGALTADAEIRDLSISGAFIETQLQLPVHTHLLVTVPLAAAAARDPQNLPACVVRRDAGGIAVEWRDMACPTLLALLRGTGDDVPQLCERDHVFDRCRP